MMISEVRSVLSELVVSPGFLTAVQNRLTKGTDQLR
jgi:hypothetical protein